MADSSLSIRVRALIEGLQDVARLNDELVQTATAATKAGDAGANAGSDLRAMASGFDESSKGLKGLVDELGPADKIIGNIDGKIRTLIGSFIALAGVMSLKEAADVAARTETLGVTLGVVANNAGYTKDQIAQYENQLKSLGITTGAARESLIQLVQAGINLNQVNEQGVSKAAELARAAQDLAVVTGENSSDTLSRLILNIRQLDTEGLRYLGLSVDVQAAQERFAQSIGKSADALTQQQKQQAVMNAALQEAQALAGAYEASLGTVGKQLSSMSRYQTEAANSVGNSLLPAYGELVASATEFLKVIAQVADEIDKTTNFGTLLGQGVGEAAESLTTVLTSVVQLIANLAPAFGLVVVSAGRVASVIGDIVNDLVVATDETNVFVTAMETAALLVAGLADGIQVVRAAVLLIGSGWQGIIGIISAGLGQIVGIVNDDLGSALDSLSVRMLAASEASKVSADKIFADFSNGNTAVQKLIDLTSKAQGKLSEYGKGSNFDEVAEQIRALTAAQRDLQVTQVEAVDAGNQIRTSIEALGESGVLTTQQMGQLTQRLGASLSGISKSYQETIKALNVSLSTVNGEAMFSSLSKEARELSGRLSDLAQNAITTQAQFQQAFSNGINSTKTVGELEAVARSLVSARQRTFEVGESAAATRIKFNELFNSTLDATKTSADLEVLSENVKQLGMQGVLSGEQLNTAFARIEERGRELDNIFANSGLVAPLQSLGLTLEGVTGGLSEAAQVGVKAFQDIANAVKDAGSASSVTSSELLKIFNKSLGTASTLDDLVALKEQLDQAAKSGVVFGQTYKDALGEAARKFDDLFESQLKSADTRTEYDALIAQVKDMGAQGTISGTQMTLALDQIREKAFGAREQISNLSRQTIELANAQATTLRASTTMETAQLNTEQQKRRLVELTTQARRGSSRELQVQVQYQEAIVRQAEAEQRRAEAMYRVQVTQVDLLIAKQKELNAQKRVEQAPQDEGAQAAAAVAEQEAQRRQEVVDRAKQAVAETDLLVAATEKAVQQAKAYADQMGIAVQNTNKTTGQVNSLGGQVQKVERKATVAVYTAKNVSLELQRAGFSLEDAQRLGLEIMHGVDGIAAFGRLGIQNWRRIGERIENVIEHQNTMQNKAQDLTEEFNQTANRASLIEQGMAGGYRYAGQFVDRTSALAKAFEAVQVQARQINKASQDAVTGFSSSAASLQIELLNAQGKTEEASRRQYAIKQQDLTLEYQILQAKIQSATVTARAAGLSTTDLQRQMNEATKAYNTSRAALRDLQKIDEEKARKQDEQAKKESKDQSDLTDQKIDDIGRVADANEERNPMDFGNSAFFSEFTTNLVADMPATRMTNDVQSIANTVDLLPTKKVQVDFTNGASKVSASLPENEATDLLSLIEKARKRS